MSDRQPLRLYQSQGIQFVIGRLKGASTTTVQSVLFDSDVWTAEKARTWLGEHGFKSGKLDETDDRLRFRQREPGEFEGGSMRTIAAGRRDNAEEIVEHLIPALHADGFQVYQETLTSGTTDGHAHSYDPAGGRSNEADGHSHPLVKDGDTVTGLGPGGSDNHEHAAGTAARQDKKRDRRMQQTYANLAGVEIFRVGTWNGDKYNEADLDDIVANFPKVGFDVPVKLGHSEGSGDPAFGWVSALRRVGDRLVADFRDLPEKLFKAIKERRFDAVSSEIFWNLKRGGRTFRRALKAVALLGAETPAVAGLKPLRDSFDIDGGQFEALQTYDLSRKEIMAMAENKNDAPTVEELQAQLEAANGKIAELTDETKKKKTDDTLALKLNEQQETIEKLTKQMAESEERERKARVEAAVKDVSVPALRHHFHALYSAALGEPEKKVSFTYMDGAEEKTAETPILEVVDDLKKRVNKFGMGLRERLPAGDISRDVHEGGADDPGAELDKLAKAYMTKNPKADYAEAFNAVRADPENAQLVRAYASSR